MGVGEAEDDTLEECRCAAWMGVELVGIGRSWEVAMAIRPLCSVLHGNLCASRTKVKVQDGIELVIIFD